MVKFRRGIEFLKELKDSLLPKLATRVGLDIGSSSVKVVELREKAGGAFELVRFGIEPLKEKTGRAEVVESIKKVVEAARPTTNRVNSSISGQAVIVRYIQFPKMTEDELAGAIGFEAEKYIPFNIADVVLDHQVLAEARDGKMSILLVAAKLELIQDHIKLIEEANLVPALIDVDSFAIINAFEMSYPATSGTIALLNIGAKLTNINILKDGVSYFTRDVQMGGEDITRLISEKLGIDLDRAEELKCNPGEREKELLENIRPELDSMLGELRLSFDYYESQFEKGIDKVFLSGGSANLKGLLEFLNEGLRLDIEVWDPLKNLKIGPGLDRGKLASVASGLAVCIGLALRKA